MPDLGHITGALYFWRDRELFLNLLELPSGSRLLYNYMRIGGVKRDLPDGFQQKTERILKLFEQRLDEYADLFENSKIFRMRTEDVGKFTGTQAMNMRKLIGIFVQERQVQVTVTVSVDIWLE